MKSNVSLLNVSTKISNTPVKKAHKGYSAIKQILFFVLGVFVSRGYILNSYSPFAAALVAAAPFKNVFAVMSGSCLGYVLPPYFHGSMRYVSTIIAVAAIRWTLSDMKFFKQNNFFSSTIAFIPMVATGIALNSIEGISLSSIGTSVSESCFAFFSAYFFSGAFDVISTKNMHTFQRKDIVCVIITYCIILLSLSNVFILHKVSVGKILALTTLLSSAYTASVFGGSVVGAILGALFGLTSTNFAYIAGTYALGGVLAGVFSSYGKSAVAGVFVIINLAISILNIHNSYAISGIYEVMIATIIFALLPQKVLNFISCIFKEPSNNSSVIEGLRKNTVLRFDTLGKALCSVTDSIDSVAEKLAKLNCKDKSLLADKVIDKACPNCPMKAVCLDKEKDHTYDYINSMIDEYMSEGNFDQTLAFADRCFHFGRVEECVRNECEMYKANQNSIRRAGELRDMVSSQISSMGKIFSDISNELDTYECFDLKAAYKVEEIFRAKGIISIDTVCRVDKHGRMCIESETAYVNTEVFNSEKLLSKLNRTLGRTFSKPSVNIFDDRCYVKICEETPFKVKIGFSQHVCHNGTLCGDSYDCFDDGTGKVVIILSDGMGTGGRAAVDGTMAANIMSRLTKAGMSFKSAFKVVNSALLIKSSEESLAAIDVLCIDLYSGEAEFVKAGAPVSFVKKGTDIVKIESQSLPIGILNDVNLSSQKIQLSAGDAVLIMSDGAISCGDELVREKLSSWDSLKTDCKNFSEDLVDTVISREADGFDDDISAITIQLF